MSQGLWLNLILAILWHMRPWANGHQGTSKVKRMEVPLATPPQVTTPIDGNKLSRKNLLLLVVVGCSQAFNKPLYTFGSFGRLTFVGGIHA